MLLNDTNEYLEVKACKRSNSPNVYDLTIYDVPVGLKVIIKKCVTNFEVELGIGAFYDSGTWLTKTCIAKWDNTGRLPEVRELSEPRYGKSAWFMGSVYSRPAVIAAIRSFCFSSTGKDAISSTLNHHFSIEVARLKALKEGQSAFMNFLGDSF